MKRGLTEFLLAIDRRVIYCLVAVFLAVPILFEWKMNPGVMSTAREAYDAIEAVRHEEGSIVVVAIDWGPATKAENQPQTEAVIRHLMLRRIPLAVVTLTPFGAMYTREIPTRLAAEIGREYGKDWVSWGYQPGWMIAVRGLAKDIPGFLKGVDANGRSLDELPAMKGVEDASNVALVCEFTGLVGAVETWIRYFHVKGKPTPIAHGCTSITIPQGYNYLDARQIVGLLEGMAGAASYNELLRGRNEFDVVRKALSELDQPAALRALEEEGVASALDKLPPEHSAREKLSSELEKVNWPDAAPIEAMTCQSFAHLLILLFIILGNVGLYLGKRERGEEK